MITIKISGGFANQLFQYSLGYDISKHTGHELRLDVSNYHNGYVESYLLDYLNINFHKKIIYKYKEDFIYKENLILCETPIEVVNDFDLVISDRYNIINNTANMMSKDELINKIKNFKNIYIDGVWANTKYLDEDNSLYREMFKLKNVSKTVERFKEMIKDQQSVAIHIRAKNFEDLGLNTQYDFFRAAIVYIKQIYPEAVFYFFSNDIDEVKKVFGNFQKHKYIKIVGGTYADIEEFLCMTSCKHRVLSLHSTYSIWASYLNANKDKIDIMYRFSNDEVKHTKEYTFLNDRDISELNKKYSMKNSENDSIYCVEKEIEKLIEDSDYNNADALIDKISFDFYNVNSENYIKLLWYKAKIYINYKNFSLAEQCLYKQKQFIICYDDFSYDYSYVLYKLNRIKECAIYAAIYDKSSKSNGENLSVNKYIANDKDALNIYDTIIKCKKKHFIIVDDIGFTVYAKYMPTIAIILKEMGNEVTFVNIYREIKLSNDYFTNEVQLQYCNKNKDEKNEVYRFGIERYNTKNNNVKTIIEELAGKNKNLDTVVLNRCKDITVNQDINGIAKLIFLDFENDVKQLTEFNSSWNERLLWEMYCNSDFSIAFDETVHNKIIDKLGQTRSRLFEYKESDELMNCKCIDQLLNFDRNFLDENKMYELATFILQKSNNI